MCLNLIRNNINGRYAPYIKASIDARERATTAFKQKNENLHIQWRKKTMNRKYTAEIKDYLKSNSIGRNDKTLVKMINERFSTSYTESTIRALRYRLKAPSGIDARFKPGSTAGIAYRYKPGQEPKNKGKSWNDLGIPLTQQQKMLRTCFKKGNRPKNYLPIGTVVTRSDGYLWKKIADPNKWKQLHVILWEKANGPVPKGKLVTFLDGNSKNLQLNNLFLISRQENRDLNFRQARSNDAQITKAVIQTGRIFDKVRELETKKEI